MAVLKNPRHEQFVQLIAAGVSHGKAYTCAGFSSSNPDSTGKRLLKTVQIQQRLNEIQNLAAQSKMQQAAVDRNWVLAMLRLNVERSMKLVTPLDEKGNPVGEFKYEGSVANRALELLGKELGLFIDRSERITWDGDLSKLDPETRARFMLSLAERAFPGDPEKAARVRAEVAREIDERERQAELPAPTAIQ